MSPEVCPKGGGGGGPNMRSGQSCRTRGTVASVMYIITIKWATYLHVLVVSRSQTLIPREGEGESGKVLYIGLFKCLVRGATNQITSLVCGGISDCEWKINMRAQ